jgi:hypothetical protein
MNDVNAKLHDALVTILPADTAFVLVYAGDDDVASLSNLPPEVAKELLGSVMNAPPKNIEITNVARDC